MVRDFVQQLRQASGLPPGVRCQHGRPLDSDPTKRPPTLRALTWFIVKRPEKRVEEDEQILTKLCQGQAKLATTVDLARDLAAIVRQQQAEELNGWLLQASQSRYRIWNNFAASLNQDRDAVQAALELTWSNGPTEGHVNRLKNLKRLMYGRAKDDLLRQRILWQGRWSFT